MHKETKFVKPGPYLRQGEEDDRLRPQKISMKFWSQNFFLGVY